jgi:plastocyanin
VALALVAAFVLCLFALPMAMRARAEGSATGTGAGTPTKEGVEELDNIFDPSARHVAPGSTVEWTNDGRNPHTVTADDGSFDSGNQAPGATYTMTFPKAGVYRYYCRYHGGPNGIGMAGVIVVGDATVGIVPCVGHRIRALVGRCRPTLHRRGSRARRCHRRRSWHRRERRCHIARTPRIENPAAAATSGTDSNQVWRRRTTSLP